MPKPLTKEPRATARRKNISRTEAIDRLVKTPEGYVLVRKGQYFIDAKEIDNVSPDHSVTFITVNDNVKILVTRNEEPKFKVLKKEDVAAFLKGIPVETVALRGRSHRIVRGIGSTLDIFPDTDYRDFVPKKTTAERVRGYFEITGKHLHRSIRKVAAEND